MLRSALLGPVQSRAAIPKCPRWQRDGSPGIVCSSTVTFTTVLPRIYFCTARDRRVVERFTATPLYTHGRATCPSATPSSARKPSRIKKARPTKGRATRVDKILNCVLAHHGSLEFGSPVTAACAEAFILSQVDMTDARLAEISTEGRKMLAMDPEARWARVWQFPGGVFIGDWGPATPDHFESRIRSWHCTHAIVRLHVP